MATEKYEFQSHNSPWTEVYAMFCQREEQAEDTSMQDAEAEQQPTHDALADVYNRDDKADTRRKRF